MAREFRLPDIGEGLTEAEIVRWHVPVGDSVVVDQTLVEVETDKAVTEIPSPFAGVVLHHGGGEGDVLPVGEILVVIGENGETWPPAQEAAPIVGTPSHEAAPIVGTLSEDAVDLTPPPAVAASSTDRPTALPLVRRLARELGVDLDAIAGTGPGGRVTREDVMAAGTVAPAAGTEPGDAGDTDERRPLSRLRKTIAANLSRSWSEIVHVSSFFDVDATRLLGVRAALQDRHETQVPIDALVVAAVLPALRAFPDFNATLDGDHLIVHRRHDVGIAVDTPEGLLVAVIRDAGTKGILELAAEVRRLGEGARARTLGHDELSGQTFTVSNIGAVAGGGHGTPIIPPDTIGILAVGRATNKPVVRDGQLAVAPVMPLSLSYDHRVIDGGVGRRFLAMVAENLAEPALFLA
ncbi:MAG: dihydrolipoamide acetyltransferase family protein [Acidimicrobiales bacterium]